MCRRVRAAHPRRGGNDRDRARLGLFRQEGGVMAINRDWTRLHGVGTAALGERARVVDCASARAVVPLVMHGEAAHHRTSRTTTIAQG